MLSLRASELSGAGSSDIDRTPGICGSIIGRIDSVVHVADKIIFVQHHGWGVRPPVSLQQTVSLMKRWMCYFVW